MRRNTGNRYSIVMLCVVAALLCVSIAFIWAVDPYAVHTRPRIEGFNALKPHAYSHAYAAKTALATQARAQLLMLGNSRIDAGIDSDSDVISQQMQPAFNLAIPGAGLDTSYRSLLTTDVVTGVRQIILGVDFLDFPVPVNKLTTAAPPAPHPASKGAYARLKLLSETTLSLDSLSDSLNTLRAQGNQYSPNMTASGHNSFAQYKQFVRSEGHWAIFHQRNVENARTYLRKPRQIAANGVLLSPSFHDLQHIIDWCAEHDVQLDLVIYPYHVHILELLDMAGLWPLFEQWKQLLVERVGRQGNTEVKLWDFSGYHDVASEPVPAKGDTKTHMNWYWEAGHFKAALGDEILGVVLNGASKHSIGGQLTPNTIESTLQQTRKQRDDWRQSNRSVQAYLQSIVDKLQTR